MQARHIVAVTIGTGGDVFPYLELGRALGERGLKLTICAPEGFREIVTKHDLAFHGLGPEFDEILESKPARDLVDGSRITQLRTIFTVRDWLSELVREPLHRVWQAVQAADLVLYHPFALFVQEMAEARRIPAFLTSFQPAAVTSEFPLCILPARRLPRLLNRRTYDLFRLHPYLLSRAMNEFRQHVLGTKPRSSWHHPLYVNGQHVPTIGAFSPALVAPPHDWPQQVHVTGAWFTSGREDWRPGRQLQAFLDAGPPPVYFGFGSFPWNAARNTSLIIEAVRLWGGRAVVARGWGGINKDDLPDTFCAIGYAPHERLFPLMSGLVHHGGAGTTHIAMRSGRPTFVTPIISDGGYWGGRVYESGAGPRPIELRSLDARMLAERLTELTSNDAYTRNARALGAKIANERGVETAVSLIEQALSA